MTEHLQSRPEDESPIGGRLAGGFTRQHMLKSGAAVAGALAVPAFAGKLVDVARAQNTSNGLTLAPRYYPLASFNPDIDLAGKLAVISGASRGNGRAIGEALAALGVDVIGTSRNPARVPGPPAFPLLQLDVSDPASVFLFTKRLTAHPTFRKHGQADILVNNAGRFVFGQIVPVSAADWLSISRIVSSRCAPFTRVMWL